uniref:Sodium/calcium exchanger membrane region domain-containing protein n=1 Tax=Caldiarchaeum subterraneum TaxID=311458 RepID=A0A7C5Y418_CALS0
MTAFLDILASVVFLIVSTILFVDGVEVVSYRLGLTRFATGAFLAAVLTALPETTIAIASYFYNDSEATLVGMGSVLAAPSITLTFAAPLIAIFLKKHGSRKHVAFNYMVFAVYMTVAVLVSNVSFTGARLILGPFFIISYLVFARLILSREGELMEEKERSFCERLVKRKGNLFAVLQMFVSAMGLAVGADLFIDGASAYSSPFTLALLVSPLATCLEEVLVAFYWTFRQKADVAIGLLSGENLIQSTFVVGVGMIFTGWNLPAAANTVLAVYLSAAVLLSLFFFMNRSKAASLVILLYPVYIFAAH